MEGPIFYAHTDPNKPDKLPEEGANWQKLADHLKETAELARTFADAFGASDWGYIAGFFHDVGKYSKKFQNYLRHTCDVDSHIEQKTGRVDHSTAGAKELVNKYGNEGRLLASCIAGHHSGLLDGSGTVGSTLNDRLNKTIPTVTIPDDLFKKLPPSLESPISLDKKRKSFQLFLLTKMIYSSLVDADFLNTEKFMANDRSQVCGLYPALTGIAGTFWENISTFHKEAPTTYLNKTRNEIYSDCLLAAEKEPGLFSLTVPTGGGKTLSSMAFALKHAEKFGHKRIIYVIPYTSIIEQNADVFRKFLDKGAVLEHHCNFESREEDWQSRLASENWDAPVIATTTVQFYESFFANRSSRNRKLHNVANSIIILDEVQNIPINYLHPCIELIRELSVNYNCSIVLCSATQPAIQSRDDFKIGGLEDVREIVSDPHLLADSLKRIDVHQIIETKNIDIGQRIADHDRVLCIVNTKKHAKELYNLIGQSPDNYHLSTNMCPAHRREKFAEIRQKLKERQTCRVISTQLIEAGVDIDFPVVYRSMAGLDSIAQAAGRCNREGKLDKGQVYIFEPEEVKLQGHLLQTAQEASGVIHGSDGEILTLDNIDEYFKNLYWVKGDDVLDKKGIILDIKAGLKKLDFPFKTISDKFRIIDNNTQPVIIPFDAEAVKLISDIDYVKFPRILMRKLQKYTVNLYPYQWQWLYDAGGLEVKENMFSILIREELYNNDYGLDTDNLQVSPEDLIA